MTPTSFRPPDFRGQFLQGPDDRERAAGAAGILRTLPAAVATPADADDLAALVRWCAETATPLVPRAAATGMPGGNLGSGVVVDMVTNFRGAPVVDADRRLARVEPGVTLRELDTAAAQAGLRFPVDPSSGARCTLGGMVANNAAGAHSVRFGATRAWVQALDVVLADGTRAELRRGERPANPTLRAVAEAIRTALEPDRPAVLAAWPRVRKNSSGYALREFLESGDLLDLLVGSEGTLALVTAAELRLAALPGARGLAFLEFSRLDAASAAVARILPLRPATCEMLDRTFLDLVRDAGEALPVPLHPRLEAVLLVEVEAHDGRAATRDLDALADRLTGIADRVTLATEAADQQRLWAVRHAASPIIARRTDSRVSMQFIEDGVVPLDQLPAYVRALRDILDRHHVPAVIFGHAGDGNLHVNPLVDVADPAWRDTVAAILAETASVVASLGGTLAGEHGDGRLRAPLLETIWGPAMVARFRQVKQSFDEHGILNPGVILPLPGQQPLDALRDYPAAFLQQRLARAAPDA